jgi:hypothetical protein
VFVCNSEPRGHGLRLSNAQLMPLLRLHPVTPPQDRCPSLGFGAHSRWMGGIIQMRSSRQRKIVQAGDGFTWLLGTTVCLILIVCLISVAPSTILHARSPHALQHAATALASDAVPISSANGSGLCFSALPERAMWHRFLPSAHEKTSTVDAVLAMVRVWPSCQQ